jgi:soluble lytic murein transglycosylase-like protein
MTNYIDALDTFEPTVVEQDVTYQTDWYYDPVKQVQQRVIIVICLVLMVSTSLALLAVPRNIGTGSADSQVADASAEAAGIQDQAQLNDSMSQAFEGQSIASLFTPEIQYWSDDIVKWSGEHDVDPNAVATIMQIESCGNPQAISVAGARGLFQVMPFHFTSNENMMDPDTNAFRGLNFLVEQLRYTGGDMELSFAGYNGGYAASGGDYANWPNETQRYYQWASGIYADAQSGSSSSETLETWLNAGGRPGCQTAAAQLGL